jgi:dTDP-4-amino-4,6-dideoxygalactose transaminase
LQAAILSVKLRRLDADNEARRTIAAVYDSAFARLPVGARAVPATGVHVYHQYVIRTANREHLRRDLSCAGIGSAIHYPVPVHRQPAYAPMAMHAGLPVTDNLCDTILSLPMYPQLALEDAKRVAETVAQGA